MIKQVIEFWNNSNFCPQDDCRYNGIQLKLVKAVENFSFTFAILRQVFMLTDLPVLYLNDLAG